MEAYDKALESYAGAVARAVGVLADKIIDRKGRDNRAGVTARAGTPIGILLKRCLQKNMDIRVRHYSISIIRGRELIKMPWPIFWRVMSPGSCSLWMAG